MVIDGGAPTTVSYISNALPIPADKNEIALCTAMAGEMLGMKLIYMDAGSGARRPISTEMIERVSQMHRNTAARRRWYPESRKRFISMPKPALI